MLRCVDWETHVSWREFWKASCGCEWPAGCFEYGAAFANRMGVGRYSRRKGKIVDELDSAEADDVTSRKRSALDCHELGAEASVTKGSISQTLFHGKAGQAERRCGNGQHAGTVRGSRDIGECCEAELW